MKFILIGTIKFAFVGLCAIPFSEARADVQVLASFQNAADQVRVQPNEVVYTAYQFLFEKLQLPRSFQDCDFILDYDPKLTSVARFYPTSPYRIAFGKEIMEVARYNPDALTSTLIHELLHAYRHTLNGGQDENWFEEGLAQLTERIFLQELAGWRLTLKDSVEPSSEQPSESDKYYADYLLLEYFFEHLGKYNWLRRAIQNKNSGWTNILEAAQGLTAIEEKYLNPKTLWKHFVFALLLNDRSVAEHDLMWLGDWFVPVATQSSLSLRGKQNLSSPHSRQSPASQNFHARWGRNKK